MLFWPRGRYQAYRLTSCGPWDWPPGSFWSLTSLLSPPTTEPKPNSSGISSKILNVFGPSGTNDMGCSMLGPGADLRVGSHVEAGYPCLLECALLVSHFPVQLQDDLPVHCMLFLPNPMLYCLPQIEWGWLQAQPLTLQCLKYMILPTTSS